MMSDVWDGKVNCVLVKDLSRFGRDYIETGRLIQRTFPAFNVRFIAVTDGFDSLYADRTDSSLILPMKNFINDSYCRDISIKVRAQQKAKRMEGKYIGAFAVYGYQKDPQDKNRLTVDRYAADIVRQIYAWKIAGMSLGAIAEKLNAAGVLAPTEYKRIQGMKYATGFEGGFTAKWAAASVKRILTDPAYIGTMAQGKREKVNYKVKKRIDKPREEWICVKNTHEAIVSEAVFFMAQELQKYDGRVSGSAQKAHLFSGILFCADCKAPMVKRVNSYRGKKKVFYICRTKNKSMGCSRHSIEEGSLKRIIYAEIRKHFGQMVSRSEAAEYMAQAKVDYGSLKVYDAQTEAMQKEYDRYERRKDRLSDDFGEGLLDQKEYEAFGSFFERKCVELKSAIDGQKKSIREMLQNGAAAEEKLETIRSNRELQGLDRELLVAAVRKIFVYENQELEISFRFSDERKGLPDKNA